MPWKQVSAGQYERPFDATDFLMKTVCLSAAAYSREHWTVNIIARGCFGSSNTDEIIAALRRAWIQTRYNYPFIACVSEDNKHTYEVANKTSLQEWVLDSFFVEDGTFDAFLVNVRPRTYSSIHYFPNSSELVMRSHHWQVDGVGSLNLMNRFFHFFSADEKAPTFGDEAKNLPPGLSEAAGFPTSATQAAEDKAQEMFLGFVGNLPSIGLAIEAPIQGLGGTRRQNQGFSSSTARLLVAACKQREVSVASAVHAAIAVAAQEMKTESPIAKNYTSVAAYNYRPYLLSPYNDANAFPMGCYMLGLPFSHSPADFSTHAQEFQKMYHQPLKRSETPLFEAYDIYADKMAIVLSQPPPPSMPPASQPQLSSLGIMDGRLQATFSGKRNVSIAHVEVVTDMMTPGILLYQWSWAGKFFLSANYNEAFCKDDYVEKYLARTQEILFQELGVKVEKLGAKDEVRSSRSFQASSSMPA
ncbi:hypothetical protein MMC18_000717 [Xylographa bjoerkii]|nr:hypothetical protein [Xylographa bjoerkii]